MSYQHWAKRERRRAELYSVVTLWYEDDDGFLHRRNGRFHHRRDPRHIERCVNMIKQRNAMIEEVTVR